MNKNFKLFIGLAFLMLTACGQTQKKINEVATDLNVSEQEKECSQTNEVIKTIMARRSIRKYKPVALEDDKLKQILECGINAPNGMYKESWEIRVVNNPEFMGEIEKGYSSYLIKNGKKRLNHPSYGAPCLIFIAHDTTYDLSQVDCGLLGENIILAAQSLDLGTCCLGGIARYMNSPEAADLLKRLELPASYNLLYALAVGYPDENPAAKPRNADKIKIIE